MTPKYMLKEEERVEPISQTEEIMLKERVKYKFGAQLPKNQKECY